MIKIIIKFNDKMNSKIYSSDEIKIYSSDNIKIYMDSNEYILYVNIIDGNYNENFKEKFMESIEYYKNFWILINQSDLKYYQIFLFNDVKIYPFEFYDIIFKTLKSLEKIYEKNLYSSCLVNNSNTINVFKPLLNMYKSIKPFKFVSTLDEAYEFLYENNN